MSENLEAYYQLHGEENVKPTRTGRLTIFFGYAAGVGKTYAMLNAAQRAREEGWDVVVGYVEQHSRPDTLALLNGLEQLPRKNVDYKGVCLSEFDLDAALERHPQLLLVDELAHSNAPSMRHSKRYQDVEELLRAGIDVYSTVNVQHLESLNDLVESITGVSVKERIPDSVFDAAAEVTLVDIEPDNLIKRLEEGKIYRPIQAGRALENFFSRENLEALREIALRRTADRISRLAQKEERELTVKAGEHILTCISAAPSSVKVLRTAARMAEAFHSSFTALYVETAAGKDMEAEDRRRLQVNMRLAEQLGARVVTIYGEEPAMQIAAYARASGVTKIVLGRTNHGSVSFLRHKTLVDRLSDLTGDIDIYIIPDFHPRYRKRLAQIRHKGEVFSWKDVGKLLLVMSSATTLGCLFYACHLREANIITVYLLAVLLTAIWTTGYGYGIAASFISVVAFNFFFTIPRFSLMAFDPNYPITFLIMLAASFIASSLAARVKRQARDASERAYYMELLTSGQQMLQRGKDAQDIIAIAAGLLSKLLDRPILYALIQPGQPLEFQVVPEEQTGQMLAELSNEERAVAEWVAANNKHAGATTNSFSQAQNLYLAVRGNQGALGVVGIPFTQKMVLDAFTKNLMIAMLDDCGFILERRRLQDEKQAVEMETQRERLRANLLRAISHDLRTPLTSISAGASVLMETSINLDEERRKDIVTGIYDDAMWLVQLTENLLSITRIENGSLQLALQAELMDDVFREAFAHIDRRAENYHIQVQLEDDMLMARMDARLIIQVLINIVNNAIEYTPEGSDICLMATKSGNQVVVDIADNGPGISDEAKAHLFDMFYTAGTHGADSRRGLGLGLNLCKSIVEAHGGQISVRDNQPQGAVFSFSLPLEEVHLTNG